MKSKADLIKDKVSDEDWQLKIITGLSNFFKSLARCIYAKSQS